MNRRPATFTLISVFLTTVLLASIAYVLTSDFNIKNTKDMYLAALLICGGALLGIAALGTWRPRPWGYLALTTSIGFITALDVIALYSTRNLTIYFLPDLVMVGSGALILSDPDARDLFFNASRRWWERAKRVALGLPSVARSNDISNSIKILNISETGCLISSQKNHQIGEPVELQIAPDFWIQATIVRQINNDFGVKFEFKSWLQKRRLKKFVASAENSVVHSNMVNSNVIPLRKTAHPAKPDSPAVEEKKQKAA